MISFRQYLQEVNLPKIYFDMDGVLADLKKSIAKLNNGKISNKIIQKFLGEIDKEKHKGLFRNADVLKEGKKVFKFVLNQQFKPYILSSSSNSLQIKKEKFEWLKEHFPIIKKGNINIVNSAKDKKNFAIGNILIDDFKINIDQWNSAGGIGMLFNGSSTETIKQLKKVL